MKKTSPQPAIYRGCTYINIVELNQMKLSFVISNDKASYVSKEHSICLFSVAKLAALNEQQIKPCVPLCILVYLITDCYISNHLGLTTP